MKKIMMVLLGISFAGGLGAMESRSTGRQLPLKEDAERWLVVVKNYADTLGVGVARPLKKLCREHMEQSLSCGNIFNRSHWGDSESDYSLEKIIIAEAYILLSVYVACCREGRFFGDAVRSLSECLGDFVFVKQLSDHFVACFQNWLEDIIKPVIMDCEVATEEYTVPARMGCYEGDNRQLWRAVFVRNMSFMYSGLEVLVKVLAASLHRGILSPYIGKVCDKVAGQEMPGVRLVVFGDDELEAAREAAVSELMGSTVYACCRRDDLNRWACSAIRQIIMEGVNTSPIKTSCLQDWMNLGVLRCSLTSKERDMILTLPLTSFLVYLGNEQSVQRNKLSECENLQKEATHLFSHRSAVMFAKVCIFTFLRENAGTSKAKKQIKQWCKEETGLLMDTVNHAEFMKKAEQDARFASIDTEGVVATKETNKVIHEFMRMSVLIEVTRDLISFEMTGQEKKFKALAREVGLPALRMGTGLCVVLKSGSFVSNDSEGYA